MRVLLVNAHGADRTYGGAERYVSDLAAGLEARGDEVAILSAFPVRDKSAQRTETLHRHDWRDNTVRRYRNHVGDWFATPWPHLERVILETRPQLIHTSNLPGIGTGIWEWGRRLGIPVVHTLHDYHLMCPRTTLLGRDGTACRPSPMLCGLRTRRLARWGRAVQVVIGVSDHVLNRHSKLFPVTTERRVIRAPLVPIDGVGPPNSGQELSTLGYIGALIPAKGIELLLEAAPGLSAQGVELRIAGDGPMRDAVEAHPNVRYEGRLEGSKLTSFLRSCDAGVVPSVWEEPGITYVLTEWLAAGRPVLATRRGGLAEADAYSGVIYFAAAPKDLLEAVGDLREPERWHRIVASVPIVDDYADADRWVVEHSAAYEAALGGPATGGSR